MRPMLGRKIVEGKEDDLPLWQMPIAHNQETTSDYGREKLQERLAKLAGDVAVISVGATYRDRNEGEESSRARCLACDPCGRRGGCHCRRRRCLPSPTKGAG